MGPKAMNDDRADQKYELTARSCEVDGRTLRQIRALRDVAGVGRGDFGGWLESEDNLSQEGDCWVGDAARVYAEARVTGCAVVDGAARVVDRARVEGFAWVTGAAVVSGEALVVGSAFVEAAGRVSGEAVVGGQGWITGAGRVSGQARVGGHARVGDAALVAGAANVGGEAMVLNAAMVTDRVVVRDTALVGGVSRVYDRAWIGGDTQLVGATVLTGSARLHRTPPRCPRSDGVEFIVVPFAGGGVRVVAEGRALSFDEARAHWRAHCDDASLLRETLDILDHLERRAALSRMRYSEDSHIDPSPTRGHS